MGSLVLVLLMGERTEQRDRSAIVVVMESAGTADFDRSLITRFSFLAMITSAQAMDVSMHWIFIVIFSSYKMMPRTKVV